MAYAQEIKEKIKEAIPEKTAIDILNLDRQLIDLNHSINIINKDLVLCKISICIEIINKKDGV